LPAAVTMLLAREEALDRAATVIRTMKTEALCMLLDV
jgi:hypothetical protein